jgi:hypothetical protein
VFTGGKMPWDKAKKTEGEVFKEYAISNGIPYKKIFVTKDWRILQKRQWL